jgi:heme exporter protein A
LATGIGFALAAGEALAVTGPNGAGKSTLLRVLAGLLAPAEGQIALGGEGVDTVARVNVHYLGHADALKPSLTVAENLDFWASALKTGRRGPPAREALARLTLAHAADLPAGYLSAGQRRRVALARLLVAPRPVWLLDEPATALDAAAQMQLARIMAEHLGSNGIIVAATHAPLRLAASRELRMGGEA